MTQLKTIIIAGAYYTAAFSTLTALQYLEVGLKIVIGAVTLYLLLRKKKK